MIEPFDSLTDHGNQPARRDLCAIAEETIERLHPSIIVPTVLERAGEQLLVDGTRYDLSAIDSIYVIGAGKGSAALVEAVLEALDRPVDGGVVAEKSGQERSIPGVEVVGAGHPIPDESSRRAGERALDIADAAGADDLVFACVTGGASAQAVAPVPGISVSELAQVTDRLLRAGCPIDEINAVRKQLSRIKGGQLTAAIAPARTVTFVLIDEVAGEAWGPTVGDASTPAAAIDVLRRRSLWEETPDTVRTALCRARETGTTRTIPPASIDEYPVQHVELADSADLCSAAGAVVASRGYNSAVLSSTVEGESREVARVFASIAAEVATRDRPFEPPCVLVSGGETTVTVREDAGEGGPNQEFALQFALDVADEPSITALALGTDGTDGPTDVAGGLVDHSTVERLRSKGIEPIEQLQGNNSTVALRSVDDAVVTGATATNLMDLRLLLIEAD
ncbi:MAG: glycerate kinase type-2 family protein [Halobacteriota archaeon]